MSNITQNAAGSTEMPGKLFSLALFAIVACSTLNAVAEDSNFTTSHFSGSGNCQSCHDNLTDSAGDDVSIVRDWGTSMMANAAKDPFWRAKVASELKRNPALSSVINDKCSQCHAPAANYEITKVQGKEITLFGPGGVLDTTHALFDAGMNGVTCTVCHQITDDARLGSLDGFSGNYIINDIKAIYGQYSNITPRPMINNTGYTPTYSAHISESKLCATCHNLKTPFVDSNGTILPTSPESDFPEQMPYTEWENSIFEDAGSSPQSCQDCHMPKSTSKVSNRPNGLGTKDGFAKHHLVGANTVMLTLLKNNSAQLDVTSSDLDLGISRAREMLQSAATIEILSVSAANGVLEARVKLTNLSGHKTPTSYPSRRMWINFKVTDSENNIVFESGKMNADGSITGSDNDLDLTQYEPHYNLITSADQVQMYETIMADSDGNLTYTLLRASHYLKDNRLTPKGFDKLTVPADVAVRGSASDDTDFNLGSDELTYRFPITATGNLTIGATLNYQPIAQGFLQDLYADADLEQVQTFKALYDEQTLKYERIADTQTIVFSSGGTTPPAPVVDLSASMLTIAHGESTTLTWNSTDANSCTASGAWSGTRPTSGSEVVSPVITSSYTINCENNAGATASAVVTVTVEDRTAPVITPPADIQIDVPAGTPVPATDSAIVAFLDEATAADNVDTTLPSISNDAPAIFPPGITTVTFTVADSAGNVGTAQASVTIVTTSGPPAPTADLSASPLTIAHGQSTTLTWNSTDATSCTASGAWSGTRPTSGSEAVSPVISSDYTINCQNNAGATASATVTVMVEDRTAPVITPPADIKIEIPAGTTSLPATDSAIAAFLDGATAVDNVDTTLPSISNDAPTIFPDGMTTVTFTVADNSGNVATAQASVTITVATAGIDTGNTLDDGSGGGGSLDPIFLLFLILSTISGYVAVASAKNSMVMQQKNPAMNCPP